MIVLTPKAAEKLNEIRDSEGLEGDHLRIGVIGGGCAGFNYNIFLEAYDQIVDMDEIFMSEGVKIVIDSMSLVYLDGLEIDHEETQFAAGFKFNNPKAKSTCGCGSSFAVA